VKSQPFVSRTFHIESPDGVVECGVKIWRPSRMKTGGYRCKYAVVSKAERRFFSMAGEDGVQALLLALRISVVEVELLARRLDGRVPAHELMDVERLPQDSAAAPSPKRRVPPSTARRRLAR